MADPTGSAPPLPSRSATGSDPRVTPVRPQTGRPGEPARPLQERVYEVADPTAPLRHAASPDAPLDTEALKGERVTVFEISEEGWAWAQLAADQYVGFMPAAALRDPGPPPTHKVAALRTLVFPGPSIKLPPVETLPLGARLAIARIQPPFAITTTGGYLPANPLAPIDRAEQDFVAVAERFIGAPYRWCGKTNLGDIKLLDQLVEEGLVEPPRFLPPPFADLQALTAWMCFANFLNRMSLRRVEDDFANLF